MLSFTNIIFTVILFTPQLHAVSNCVTVKQSKLNSWTSGGQTLSQWQVKLENAGSNAIKDITISFSLVLSDFYEIVKQTSGEYTLPTWLIQNGGIQQQGSHTFGYTVQSEISSTITINCEGSSYSSSTPSPTLYPTATPTPRVTPSPSPISPTTAPTFAPSVPIIPSTYSPTIAPIAPTSPPSSPTTHCDVVFIIDNYIMRSTSLSDSEIIAKYTNYFTDIQAFYREHFNMQMRISGFYLERNSSFSDSFNADELLDFLRSGIIGGFFPGIPTSACVYHLLTGRDLYGVGGLAFVGTACGINTYNLGLTVDLNGVDDGISVIRRLTHELGHTLGGQHFDSYMDDSLYTCDAAPDAANRVLRKDDKEKRETYEYMSGDLFFTQCATATIRNTLPSFSCLWDEYIAPVTAYITMYSGENYEGDIKQTPSYNGVQACYDIPYPYSATLSSFQVADSGSSTFRISGVRFFVHNDCIGDYFDLGLSSSYVGDSNDNQALSYMFLRA